MSEPREPIDFITEVKGVKFAFGLTKTPKPLIQFTVDHWEEEADTITITNRQGDVLRFGGTGQWCYYPYEGDSNDTLLKWGPAELSLVKAALRKAQPVLKGQMYEGPVLLQPRPVRSAPSAAAAPPAGPAQSDLLFQHINSMFGTHPTPLNP